MLSMGHWEVAGKQEKRYEHDDYSWDVVTDQWTIYINPLLN